MIVYGNKLSSADVLLINKIAVECGISFDTTRLLFYRNVNTIEKAKEFLNPSKKFFHNPFLFKDMTKVVERIILAKQLNQKVLIFGDYDADGICAVTILNKALQNFGINPIVVVPERADGYGLNLDKILSIHTKEQISLVITVDCGISDKECVKNLKNNGIDVIVTDHHEPPEELPECLIINPKVNGESYPFDGLCGAGVAYKTAYALIGEKANDYLDFTAVATVADSMNLVGENRHIVHEGLKLFSKQNIRLVFKYLIGESDKQVNSQTLAFQIAPRINAGGRMGDANCALKLFISNDQEEIYQNAVKLNSYNLARQVESERVYNEAKSLIKSNNEIINPIICIKGEDWNVGVLGIVSAKLVEEYNRPVIVFAKQDGYYKGSARSIEQVNIHNLITQSSEYLIGFGGHSQAAGLSVEIDKFNDFYKLIISKMNDAYSNVKFTKQIYCDWQIEGEISVEFAREINLLEPFGIGNKKPVF